MRRRSSYFILILLVTFAGICSCTPRGAIPRGDLAQIYAEMFYTDAVIDNDNALRRAADTSRVYAAILEKYGYTEEEYLCSQEKYLEDPTRYLRILEKADKILKDREAEIERARAVIREKEQAERLRSEMKNRLRLNVKFWPDTVWRIVPLDSLLMPFDGRRLIFPYGIPSDDPDVGIGARAAATDSLAAENSPSVIDSSAVADSPAAVHSPADASKASDSPAAVHSTADASKATDSPAAKPEAKSRDVKGKPSKIKLMKDDAEL